MELKWCLVCLCSRACYGVLRFVMESGAKGCEVYTGPNGASFFLWGLVSYFIFSLGNCEWKAQGSAC